MPNGNAIYFIDYFFAAYKCALFLQLLQPFHEHCRCVCVQGEPGDTDFGISIHQFSRIADWLAGCIVGSPTSRLHLCSAVCLTARLLNIDDVRRDCFILRRCRWRRRGRHNAPLASKGG